MPLSDTPMNTPPTMQAYYKVVWHFVRTVPPGKVVTYGQIAQTLPEPPASDRPELSGARLVGRAMAGCPPDVPWHRVVNAQGKVSSRANANQQWQLLEAEGIALVDGRIDLNRCQWQPHGATTQPIQQPLF